MIAWFARNPVAANLLMIVIVATGLFSVARLLPLEVFPSFERDEVSISVAYRGASPEEMENSVAIRIEEAIYDLEAIDQLRSSSSEGNVTVSAKLKSGVDKRDVLDDIKRRIDSLNTLPVRAEKPVVSIPERRRQVISVAISADLSERELRRIGDRVRDELSALADVGLVELDSVRSYEMAIQVSERVLREQNLSLSQIATAIEQASVDLAAGNVKTQGGEILLRTQNQAYTKDDFEKIVVRSLSDGTELTLGDLARIQDGFEEEPIKVRFNNQQAVLLEVYRVGSQSAIEVADAVKNYVTKMQTQLPENVSIDVWRDRSRIVKARLGTLLNSAWQGGFLVILLLALFLRPAVAFWVCLGIPISFMGALAVIPLFGVTLNILSLFGFILVLGIVVDDAIVTGESIYTHISKSSPDQNTLDVVIRGTHAVAVPVTFGILTTIVAFTPLLMIEGARGALFAQIPFIVIPVLCFSLIESKLILPAHLRHIKTPAEQQNTNFFMRIQQGIANGFERAILFFYRPLLTKVLRYRYISLAVFISLALLLFTLLTSGWIRFTFFPRVASETVSASLTMPSGTQFDVTDRHIEFITSQAQVLRDKYIDEDGQSVIKNVLSSSGSQGGSASPRTHVGRVQFEIISPEHRTIDISSVELMREWRGLVGDIPGAESLSLRAEIGRGSSPLEVELRGQDIRLLATVSGQIKEKLRQYPHVFDIQDSLSAGKQERQIVLKPHAQSLGLTARGVTQQVREAFFGLEVQRIQRGRDDLRIMVRYPESERQSLSRLTELMVRLPNGEHLPFSEVAVLQASTSPAVITRIDRARTLSVTADVDKKLADVEAIKRDLVIWLDELLLAYPRMSYSLEGEAREQRESFSSLSYGIIGVLFAIYCLLAIPFKSYWQPIAVMVVIPFGAAGAIAGHWIMGMNVTIFSVLGVLALVGVVVNDSLVLVDYINQRIRQGVTVFDAITQAGVARFRPVMLTSLTTFFGLMPLLLEKSTQAQFLIPMGVSLGFGILFATGITLFLVPVNYLVLNDIKRIITSLKILVLQSKT